MRNDLPEGIQPVTPEIIDHLGVNIRPEHLREINAMLPLAGDFALRWSVRTASVCYAGVRDGTPLFVFGVGQPSPLTGSAMAWMLGSSAMNDHGIWIAEVSRAMLPILHQESGARRIENWIPADYRVACKWLDWLGFTIGPPQMVINDVPHVHVFHDAEVSA